MTKLIVGLFIAVASMYWALKNQSFDAISTEITSANWWLMLVVAVLFMMQQMARSHRQMLLVRVRVPNHRFMTSFNILCVSFLFINTLPLRMGEVLRPILFLEKENLDFGSSTAIVLLERIIDLISAILMLLIVLSFANISLDNIDWLKDAQRTMSYFLPILVAIAFFPFLAQNKLERLVQHSLFPRKLRSFFLSFLQQIKALEHSTLILILMETIGIWMLTAVMYWVGAQAFAIDIIGFVESIGLLAFTMMGMAAPSAPGFAGTYEAAFVAGLDIFGSENSARNFAFALCFHWWVHVVQSSSGLYFLAKDQRSFSEIWRKLKAKQAS